MSDTHEPGRAAIRDESGPVAVRPADADAGGGPPEGPTERDAADRADGMAAGRSTGLRRVLARPELGAVSGVVLVWLLFAIVAGEPFRGTGGMAAYLNAAAPLGILSVAVALLMIAGEFDLSVGSTIGAASMAIMLLTRQFGWPLAPALAATAGLCLCIGFANGYLVVRTRLPSFIVTLGTDRKSVV